jgi:hypothetical protein
MTLIRSHCSTRPRAQRGQALIWLMGTLATSVAILYGVYNVAQVTNGKEKAINAADAAALAGSTVEARMLNLMAYNNRAMMANEAFLAQLSALESWLGYVAEAGQNIGMVFDLIPYLEEVGVLMQDASEMASEAQAGLGEAIDVVIPVLEAEKTAFHYGHLALATAGGLVAQDAASKIVTANNATFALHKDAGVALDNSAAVLALTMIKNNSAWINFTKYYDGNGRADAKQVLLGSRDDFTTNRPGQFYLNVDVFVAGLEKHGGSQLVNYNRWENEDTLEFWTRNWKGKKDYIPVGWGRSNIETNSSNGNKWSPGRAAQERARDNAKNHTGWSGVPSVYDMSDKKSADLANLSINYYVAVKRDQPANLTTQELKMQTAHSNSPLGSSEMNERLQGNRVAALGKAHVFFERPKAGLGNDWTAPKDLPRPDSAKEYGSLFSPYWQARLTDYTLTEKAAMYTAMGIDPALALITPGGH